MPFRVGNRRFRVTELRRLEARREDARAGLPAEGSVVRGAPEYEALIRSHGRPHAGLVLREPTGKHAEWLQHD